MKWIREHRSYKVRVLNEHGYLKSCVTCESLKEALVHYRKSKRTRRKDLIIRLERTTEEFIR